MLPLWFLRRKFVTMNHRLIFPLALSAIMSILSPAAVARDISRAHSTTESGREIVEVYEYDYVDIQPQFPGGESEMIRFINRERRYPAQAYRDGVEGRVMCSFVVNEDGSISHVSVLRGVSETLDREAVRVISNMPRWTAGSNDGENVSVYCILTIPFRR